MAALDEREANAQRQAKKERSRASTEQVLRQKLIQELLSRPDGRVFLRWLLERSKALLQSSYRGNPYDTAFACGETNVGLQIAAEFLRADPTAFATLLKEDQIENAQRSAARAKSDADASHRDAARSVPGDSAADPDAEPARDAPGGDLYDVGDGDYA